MIGCFLGAGRPGEELRSQPSEDRLADGTLQPREVGRGAERPQDDAAGRRDLGRDPAGRAGPMTAARSLLEKNIFYSFVFYTNNCT